MQQYMQEAVRQAENALTQRTQRTQEMRRHVESNRICSKGSAFLRMVYIPFLAALIAFIRSQEALITRLVKEQYLSLGATPYSVLSLMGDGNSRLTQGVLWLAMGYLLWIIIRQCVILKRFFYAGVLIGRIRAMEQRLATTRQGLQRTAARLADQVNGGHHLLLYSHTDPDTEMQLLRRKSEVYVKTRASLPDILMILFAWLALAGIAVSLGNMIGADGLMRESGGFGWLYRIESDTAWQIRLSTLFFAVFMLLVPVRVFFIETIRDWGMILPVFIGLIVLEAASGFIILILVTFSEALNIAALALIVFLLARSLHN